MSEPGQVGNQAALSHPFFVSDSIPADDFSFWDSSRYRRRTGNVGFSFFQKNLVHDSGLSHSGIHCVPTDVVCLGIESRLTRIGCRYHDHFEVPFLGKISGHIIVLTETNGRKDKNGKKDERL